VQSAALIHEAVGPEQVPFTEFVHVLDPPQFAAMVQLGLVHVPTEPLLQVKALPKLAQSAVSKQLAAPPEQVPFLDPLHARLAPHTVAAVVGVHAS
jgi:hypothetical protein